MLRRRDPTRRVAVRRCALLPAIALLAFTAAALLSLLALRRYARVTTSRTLGRKGADVAVLALLPPGGLASPACEDADAVRCVDWACGGECKNNAAFMEGSCACACAAQAALPPPAAFTPALPKTNRVVLQPSWTDADGVKQTARVHVTVDREDAPLVTAALLRSASGGVCAPGAPCGARCHLHRAELGYGLVQGYLAGLGEGGGSFGKRSEGEGSWRRGTVGYIPGGDNLLVALVDHFEWDSQFTTLGVIDEDDLAALDAIQHLPTAPLLNAEHGVTMAMLQRKVQFTLALEDDGS
jgi:hypothetical protein